MNGNFLKLKTKSRGLSDGLRVLGALSEALGSVPSTDMKVRTVCHPSSRRKEALFWPPREVRASGILGNYRQINARRIKINNF